MDHTCKVWSLANLVVDSLPSVQEPVHLSSYIQVWENNPMLKDQQGEAHVGQIEIPPGQEATLLWTCVHEGPVTSVQFTEDAAILVTASLDCTLRLWQVTQGALMFQINTPGPVHHMTCTHEHLYVCTEQRFLKFSLCVGGPRASSKGRRRSSQLSSTSFPRWSTDSSSGSYPKKKSKSILNKDARLSEREQDEEEEEEEGTNASPMFQGHLMHYFPQATKTQQRLHLKSSSASSMARQGMKNSKRRTWKEGTIQGGGASFFVEAFSNAFGNPNSKKINQPMMKPRISIGPSRSVKGNPRRPHSAQKVPKLRSEWNEDTWRRMTMMEDRNEFKGEYEEEQQQKDSEEIVKRNEGPRPLLSRNNPSEAMALNRIHYSVLNTKKSNSPLASSMFTAFTSPKFMLDPSASSSSSSTSLGLVMYGYGNPSPSPSPPPSPTRPLLSDTWIQTMANTFAATRRQRKRRRMVFKNTPLRVHPPLYRRASMRPKTASTRPLPPTPGLSPVTSKPRPPTSLALGTHAPHRHFIPSRSMHRGLVLLSEQEGQGKAPDKTPSQRSTSSPSKKKPSSTFASMRVHRMVQRTGGPIQILGKGKRVEQIQMKPFE
ncbi:hypothetical protein HMI54_004898 [Coelomomyces lativittatus]|nr:hypothetical protein HMI54_004898 [Coelomomyces lativittatus]